MLRGLGIVYMSFMAEYWVVYSIGFGDIRFCRWVFVCIFLLPCSALYDFYLFMTTVFLLFSKNKIVEQHHVKTKFIQDQVNQWVKTKQTVPMCTGRPSWKAMTTCEIKYKDLFYNIQIDLAEILELNLERKIIKVEPLVTMGQLSAYLKPFNLTLPVVGELDDLTVGGLIMGTGIESSSHIFGLFQHICVSFELVLADGSLVHCSKDEDPDLFYAIPWSCGTLGFLTAVDLQIIPSKRYVKLIYEPFYSLDEGIQLMKYHSQAKTNNQFVEGIMFNKDEGVIMSGTMVDEGKHVNAIGKWYKPWFYKHVQEFLEKGKSEEYIPLRDYYHRHTKALFWELEDILSFGNNALFRVLFGWMMPPKIRFLKKTQTEFIKELYKKEHVLQDFIIPIQHLKESILYFDEEVNVYPVWLCPALIPNNPGLVHSFSDKSEIYIDIGLYGMQKSKRNYHFQETTKQMENFVIKMKGYQLLYPGTYCSEEEFETMFDHTLYNQMRKRLKCNKAFPRIYGKVNKMVRV